MKNPNLQEMPQPTDRVWAFALVAITSLITCVFANEHTIFAVGIIFFMSTIFLIGTDGETQ